MEPATGTVVGGEVAVRGHVHGTRDVTVNGRLEGTVELGATLTVGPDAVVKAEVRVHRALVHGVVVGSIIATEEIVLHAGSRVVGDLFAPSVVMEDGARFRGLVRDPAEAPARVAPGSAPTSVAPPAPVPVKASPALLEAGLSPLPPRPPARPAPVRSAPPPATPAPTVVVMPAVTAPAVTEILQTSSTPAEPREERPAPQDNASRREVRRRAPRASAPAERDEHAAPRPRLAAPLSPPAARPLPGRGTAVTVKRR